jgi:16S rRNA (adenine1518-N6/adenine1519-N6)-dimethyltransferase
MVQSEVADRLIAKSNSKTYGSPSVKANWWADMSSAGTVGRSIFWPVPNVDSSLVRFIRHQPAGDEALRKATFRIIDAAFAQRRKMLRAALSDLCGGSAAASAVITAAGIDPTIRGEALELGDFIKIATTLNK